jgi:hypothetical protein
MSRGYIPVPLPVLEALVQMADELAQFRDQSLSREGKLRKAEEILAALRKAERTAEQTEINPNWGTWG